MDLQQIVGWADMLAYLKKERLPPSSAACVRELWNRKEPDAETGARLVGLELRHGSPVLALDLAFWILEVFGDRFDARVLALRAALASGLIESARRLLWPLIEAASGDHKRSAAVRSMWRDVSLASGRARELRAVVICEPSDLEVLIRTADRFWFDRDQMAALSVYRWAACSGTPTVKAYLRLATVREMAAGPSAVVTMLETALHRTGDPRLKARLLVVLLTLDRRREALSLLDDSGVGNSSDEVGAARSKLAAYARAQLLAADAEEIEPSREGASDGGMAVGKVRQRAGRVLATFGWHDQAVWQLRKVVEKPRR